jgi:hypothetical protein
MLIFWIILVSFFIVGLIGKLILKENLAVYKKGDSYFHRLYIVGFHSLYLLFFVTIWDYNGEYDYFPSNENEFREKQNIPLITTDMVLDYRSSNTEIWSQPKSDSTIIRHSKIVKLDRVNIKKEYDFYFNKQLDKTLVLESHRKSDERRFLYYDYRANDFKVTVEFLGMSIGI